MRVVLLLLAVALATPAWAAKPAFPTLDDSEQAKLADGKLVLIRDYESDQEGTVTGVMRINAAADKIWAALLDFESVPANNSAMDVAENYTSEMNRTPPSGAKFYDIHWELSAVGQTVKYNIHHTYYPAQNHLEWVLDTERGDNEIDDTVGSWTLFPVAGQSNSYDFVYITRVDTGRNVPEWVESLLTKTSLTKYIKWVKETAEAG